MDTTVFRELEQAARRALAEKERLVHEGYHQEAAALGHQLDAYLQTLWGILSARQEEERKFARFRREIGF